MFRKKTKVIFLYSLSLMAFFAILLFSAGVATAATFQEQCQSLGGQFSAPRYGTGASLCVLGGAVKTEAETGAIYNSIKCFSDSDCDDGKNNTADTCESGGTTSAVCSHTASQCTTDSQCNDNKPDTHDVCVLSSPTMGLCVNRADECSADADCDDNDDATDDLCKKEDQRPWMACYNTSNNNQDQNSGTGGLDENFMTYILIIAILAIGIKTTLSLTAEAASIVNKGLSGVTGGKIKSMGQPFRAAGKKLGGAAARPFKVIGQAAKGVGYNIAKGDGLIGQGVRKTSAFMQSRPFSEASLQRQKAKAEQSKKGYGKALGKEAMMKKLNKPTDDEIKEEMESNKMTTWSVEALEKKIRDSDGSEKERKAAASALKKIADGETMAFSDVVDRANRSIESFKAGGLTNDKGEFKDFNKDPFSSSLLSLKNPTNALFDTDKKTKKVTGLNTNALIASNIVDIDPSKIDREKMEKIDKFAGKTKGLESIINNAVKDKASQVNLMDAALAGDDDDVDSILDKNGASDNIKKAVRDAIKNFLPDEGSRKAHTNARLIQQKVSGYKLGSAARDILGTWDSNKLNFERKYGGDQSGQKKYFGDVRLKMERINRAAEGFDEKKMAKEVNEKFLSEAAKHFAEIRSKIDNARGKENANDALLAIQQDIMDRVKYTKEAAEIGESKPFRLNELSGKSKGKKQF